MLGRGAMGYVYRAYDRELKRSVAVKFPTVNDPTVLRDFRVEAQIAGQLDHPNVVPVHAVQTADGLPAVVMKLVRGETLRIHLEVARSLHRTGTLHPPHNLEGRLALFLKICDAVHYAHTRGVLHRDLKPANIMVGAHGEVYVMDWGIARLIHCSDAEPITAEWQPKSDGSAVVGTPGYMSPEQANGEPGVGGASDQASLGLLLHEIVCLMPAVPGDDPAERIAWNLYARRQKMTSEFGPVPAELRAIVAKATSAIPDDRYTDVRAMADDVRRFLRDDAVEARPDNVAQAVLRWIGRYRQVVAVALLLLAVVAASALLAAQQLVLSAWKHTEAREEAIASAISETSERAAVLDSRISHQQGLLQAVASAASEIWESQQPSDQPYYTVRDFDIPESRPPDYANTPSYASGISLEQPVFMAMEDNGQRLAELVAVGRWSRRTLIESFVDGRGTPTRITQEGAPIAWVTVAFEDGRALSYPGHGDYPEGYDPRQRPWYTQVDRDSSSTWGSPYLDSSGSGMLLPGSAPLRSRDGRFIGVVAVKMPVDRLVGDLLVGDTAATLVDARGGVITSADDRLPGQSAVGLDNRPAELPLLPYPELVDAVAAGRSGALVVNDGGIPRLAVFSRMAGMGWTLVVLSDAGGRRRDG